ncbi:unnamed protein product [Rhizophagus irregularis]|nr:unnamed protein product [Rhizophagus irregularis]
MLPINTLNFFNEYVFLIKFSVSFSGRSQSITIIKIHLFHQVLRNGLSGRNSVNLTSQSSILAVTTATKFTKPTVGYWLLGTAGFVFGIVVLGGLTRLTESGLSIVEWKPITGIIPPLNMLVWKKNLQKYKQFSRVLNCRECLGCHYRLAAHLGSAILALYGYAFNWTTVLRDAKIANGTFPKAVAKALANPAINTFRRSAIGMTALACIGLPGLMMPRVDSSNEISIYGTGNCPPKSELIFKNHMQKRGDISLWRYFFDNPTTVQFDHRVLAVTTLSIIIALWLYSRKIPLPSKN